MAPSQFFRRDSDNTMSDMDHKGSSTKSCFMGFLKQFFVFLLVVGYSVGGAYLFICLEKPNEEIKIKAKQTAADNLQSSREYIVANAWYLIEEDLNRDQFLFKVYKNLNLYRVYVVLSAQNDFYDGKRNEWDYDWTFPKSILFTVTTIGTIGYGHIVPETFNGKFVCIYYGMIGIPLMLLFLANIGDFLARSFKYIYSRFCCRWCRIRRVVSDLHPNEKLQPQILWKDEVYAEPYMDTDLLDVPIIINLVVIFIYLMMGAVLFQWWENWTLTEGIYFSFITLITIGFGDYVPGQTENTSDFIASMKMIATIAYCVFGMALLSMAINLMQEQLIGKSRWLANQIGMKKEDEDDSWKYKNMKRHEPGSIMETPVGKDGNQPTENTEEVLRRKRRLQFAEQYGYDE